SRRALPAGRVAPLEHHHGRGVVDRVRQRQVGDEPLALHRRRQARAGPQHRPHPLLHDPDVPPAERARPDLRERLLGRETRRQAGVDVLAAGEFRQLLGVEAARQEPLGVVLRGPAHARDLDQVEAHRDDHARASRRLTPPRPATSARLAMPRNRPCSTTPGIAFSSAASSSGSKGSANRQSTTRLPLSVTKGSPPCSRSRASAPSRPSRCTVRESPKRTTSTGTGALSPSRATSFDSSPMSTNVRAEAATTFSRSSAPPRPLTASSEGESSSIPSTARSTPPD